MKVVLAFVAVLSISAVFAAIPSENIERHILSTFEGGDTKTLFKVYHYLYKKTYDLNSEEAIRRYQIFKKNMEYIRAENQKGHSYTLGYTHLVDMTLEEARKMYLNSKPEKMIEEGAKEISYEKFFDTPDDDEVPEIKKQVKNFFDTEEDEDEIKIRRPAEQISQVKRYAVDWRNVMTPVRDQGQCGSCWAFASAGTIEGNWNIKYKTSPTQWLSTQQLVDCDTNSSGCDGGWTLGAIYYYGKDVGLMSETEYPYKAVANTCDSAKIANAKKIKSIGTRYCQTCTIDTWFGYLAKGPIGISSYVTDNWFYYTGGIYSIKECNSNSSNHAVIAVGWGIDTDTNGNVTEYAIVRNSWGESWGEKGYIRIKFQPELKNSCFINLRATQPIY